MAKLSIGADCGNGLGNKMGFGSGITDGCDIDIGLFIIPKLSTDAGWGIGLGCGIGLGSGTLDGSGIGINGLPKIFNNILKLLKIFNIINSIQISL